MRSLTCGGVGLLDYDGDGWLDVCAVQEGPYPPSNSALKNDPPLESISSGPESHKLLSWPASPT